MLSHLHFWLLVLLLPLIYTKAKYVVCFARVTPFYSQHYDLWHSTFPIQAERLFRTIFTTKHKHSTCANLSNIVSRNENPQRFHQCFPQCHLKIVATTLVQETKKENKRRSNKHSKEVHAKLIVKHYSGNVHTHLYNITTITTFIKTSSKIPLCMVETAKQSYKKLKDYK